MFRGGVRSNKDKFLQVLVNSKASGNLDDTCSYVRVELNVLMLRRSTLRIEINQPCSSHLLQGN